MKQDNSYILTMNGGSLSIKFAFYQAGEPLKLAADCMEG